MTEIFGRRRVPKIADGLSIFIYYELRLGRGIPGDGPVRQVLDFGLAKRRWIPGDGFQL